MRKGRFGQRRDRRRRMTQTPQGQGEGYQPDGAGSCDCTDHVRGVSIRWQTDGVSLCRYSISSGEHLPADRL